jgi:Arc/MetJ-type ribon-helix-helix transcriptional regulator
MMLGMTMAKIAVTVPRPLLATAQRAVKEGRASSVSAYVTDALEEKAKADDLTAMLDEMLAETGGPMTSKERREAERMVGVSPRRKRRRVA